ncbi:MAG: hypothetical protein P4L31_06150 [Candidatus Babeliales bacterium]|nr:hypothetical protein [Candidatus Babeliales bacterium]
MKRFALCAFLFFSSTQINPSAPAPDEVKKQIMTCNEINELLARARALLGNPNSPIDYISDGETEDDKTLPANASDLHHAAFSCKRSSLKTIKTLLANGVDQKTVCLRTDIEVMCEKCFSCGCTREHSPKPHCNHPPMEETALQIAQNRLYDYNEKLQWKGLTAEQYTSMPTLYTGYESVGIKGVDLKKVIPLFQAKVVLLEDAMKKQQK